jgi:hypothetical protein
LLTDELRAGIREHKEALLDALVTERRIRRELLAWGADYRWPQIGIDRVIVPSGEAGWRGTLPKLDYATLSDLRQNVCYWQPEEDASRKKAGRGAAWLLNSSDYRTLS